MSAAAASQTDGFEVAVERVTITQLVAFDAIKEAVAGDNMGFQIEVPFETFTFETGMSLRSPTIEVS